MSPNSRPPPIQNQLLAALPGAVYERLLPQLEEVRLSFLEVLYEGGEPMNHVYFPNEGLISLLAVMKDEVVREIGLIGQEGNVRHRPGARGEDNAAPRAHSDAGQRDAAQG